MNKELGMMKLENPVAMHTVFKRRGKFNVEQIKNKPNYIFLIIWHRK